MWCVALGKGDILGVWKWYGFSVGELRVMATCMRSGTEQGMIRGNL